MISAVQTLSLTPSIFQCYMPSGKWSSYKFFIGSKIIWGSGIDAYLYVLKFWKCSGILLNHIICMSSGRWGKTLYMWCNSCRRLQLPVCMRSWFHNTWFIKSEPRFVSLLEYMEQYHYVLHVCSKGRFRIWCKALALCCIELAKRETIQNFANFSWQNARAQRRGTQG